MWIQLFSFLFVTQLPVEVRLNNTPLKFQQVQVTGFSLGVEEFQLERKTSERGIALFSIPSEKPVNLLISTVYSDLQYFATARWDPAQSSPPTVRLDVHPSVESTDALKIQEIRIHLQPSSEGVHVEQQIVLENPSNFGLDFHRMPLIRNSCMGLMKIPQALNIAMFFSCAPFRRDSLI
jgi:hypothetical protein